MSVITHYAGKSLIAREKSLPRTDGHPKTNPVQHWRIFTMIGETNANSRIAREEILTKNGDNEITDLHHLL